jgi:hypothetical protein
VSFQFSRVGGRGTAEIAITTLCIGSLAVGSQEFQFTSPDLDGSCDPHPTSSTSVIDFGIWAACFSPSPICRPSDYNCDCATTIIDIAYYAGGLLKGCSGDCP